jgi:glycosyltransferase involved in cell wall biosynthesis
MRIAVVNNCVPFLSGGAEHLAQALHEKFIEFGHESILVRIPFQWQPPEKVIESMAACQMLRIDNVDRVIPLKFPVYCIPHADKMLWLLHQFRQVYDFWGTRYQGLPNTPEGLRMRDVIMRTDTEILSKVRKIYTNSHVTTTRLKKFNGIDSEVLYPPLLAHSHFRCDGYGDYIFYPSRVNHTKRQFLAVEAMQFVKSDVKLVIAGSPELPEDLKQLEEIIRDRRLEGRVKLMPTFIPEDTKAELFSRALGCVYIPYDEDSYGYVTLEAFHSRKPVITCTDSGGTSIVVHEGVTGFVCKPDARHIAAAMDRLREENGLAERLGTAGFELMNRLGINWENVILRLTQ